MANLWEIWDQEWGLTVTLAGVDVSNKTVGQVTIEAPENGISTAKLNVVGWPNSKRPEEETDTVSVIIDGNYENDAGGTTTVRLYKGYARRPTYEYISGVYEVTAGDKFSLMVDEPTDEPDDYSDAPYDSSGGGVGDFGTTEGGDYSPHSGSDFGDEQPSYTLVNIKNIVESILADKGIAITQWSADRFPDVCDLSKLGNEQRDKYSLIKQVLYLWGNVQIALTPGETAHIYPLDVAVTPDYTFTDDHIRNFLEMKKQVDPISMIINTQKIRNEEAGIKTEFRDTASIAVYGVKPGQVVDNNFIGSLEAARNVAKAIISESHHRITNEIAIPSMPYFRRGQTIKVTSSIYNLDFQALLRSYRHTFNMDTGDAFTQGKFRVRKHGY